MNIKKLVRSAKGGDQNAFKKLIAHLEPKVASTVIGMLGNCVEADDVGQETFVRFYKALDSFRGDADVSTYVTRIAINLSLNELKLRKRRSMLFFSKEESELENMSYTNTDIEVNETKELVQSAIRKLSPKFRAVVVLRLIDGYSIKETAGILNIPQGTILSRLARAQKKLKNELLPLIGDQI